MKKDNGRTFDEIAAEEGEEAAIQAGIEADPDTYELDADWFRHAIPAREFMPHTRASYSWIPPDDPTNFNLFVDKTHVATGQVSENRDLFTVTSIFDETTRSFRTMRAAKNWAVEQFDFHEALPDSPCASTSRASYSWISSGDRTRFRLSVDGTPIAEGRVSEKRDLFSVDSHLEETTRSFRTMRAAKKWAINQFDSIRHAATAQRSSDLRQSFAWISADDRDKFRLFVEETLVAEGEILVERGLFSLLSRLDGTRRDFRSMVAARKWAMQHYRSIPLAREKEFHPDTH